MGRRALPIAIALTAVAGIAVAIVALGDAGGKPDPFAGLPTVDEHPGLTGAERARTRAIMRHDTLLTDLLGGGALDVRALGPWNERDEAGTRYAIGAVAVLGLPRRQDLAMRRWPSVDYRDGGDCDSTGEHYREGTLEYAARNATSLQVEVDLNEGRVVGVEPQGARSFEVVPGPSVTTTGTSAGC